ncbi:GIN domain-containing protein [Lonsdalea quercina]|uniref:GIN domain-containing protein n=1 Tax=Lonsdalea quercina TaxID=71657 RepID=UPI0039758B75
MTRLNTVFSLALLFGVSFNAASANEVEKRIPIASFNELELSKGLNVTLKCAEKPYAVASASQKVLDQLQVNSASKKLSMTGVTRDVDGWDLSDNKTDLTIFTDHPVQSIKTTFGVKLKADACALNTEQVTVDGSMGATIALSGNLNRLDARLAMGSKLINGTHDLVIQTAHMSVAMGAEADLCRAREVSGSAAMGGLVYIGTHTRNTLTSEMGATVRTRDCQ